MKVDCLRLSFKESGVAAYVRTRSDVPLRRLAAAAIAAIESVRLDAAALGAPEASMDAGGRLDLTRLHLRGMPAADLGREGILVAQTVAQGIAYIYDRWDPSGDGEPDETLRDVRARRVPRHARLKELEDLLLRRGDTDDDPFSSSRRRRRHRRPRFVWPREAFESGFEAVRAAGGRSAFLPALERGFPREERPRPAAVVERTCRVGGHDVPMWDLLVPREAEDGTALARGFVRGRWFQGPLGRLDPRIVEEFEDRGRLVNVTDGDPLAGESLDARFLVRVPRRGPGPRAFEPGALPEAAARHPGAFLADSRSPVVLPTDLPVIDDPVAAWSVLLRTTSGLFLPDESPSTPPRSFAALAGAWVVGCVPAPMPAGGAR